MAVQSGVRIGCIADDLAGATELAGILVRHGVATHLHVGVPAVDVLRPLDAEVVVVALRSRTAPAAEAVTWSLATARALVGAGVTHVYFKYAATFDSTVEGNIGPVADVLSHAMGAPTVAVCPAVPATGHTVYGGHLFVHGVPLSESPMATNPLTPMTDANLVRWLGKQSRQRVELVDYATVAAGPESVSKRFADLGRGRPCHVVCDVLDNRHLDALAASLGSARLVTGEAALAGALVAPWRARRLLGPPRMPRAPAVASGGRVVIAGSCSPSTRAQVRAAEEAGLPVITVDPLAIAYGGHAVDQLCATAIETMAGAGNRPVVVAAVTEPDAVAQAQDTLGRSGAGLLVERALARVGRELVAAGATQMIVAGGQTSSAVVDSLGLTEAFVGSEVAPGVPWTWTADGLALALTSGDLDRAEFFTEAFAELAVAR